MKFARLGLCLPLALFVFALGSTVAGQLPPLVPGAVRPLPFTIDEPQSAFTWAMSVRVIQESTGAILADLGPADIDSIPPGNTFRLRGHLDLEVLQRAKQGTQVILDPKRIRFRGGDALAVPDIAAEYRPVPFLPPLATVNISNLHMALFSGVLRLGSSGAFAGNVFALTDPNQVPVVPSCVVSEPNCQACMSWNLSAALGGVSGTTCVDRKKSDPEPSSGSLVRVGDRLQLVFSVSGLVLTFDTIINPTAPLASQRRVTGTITLSGTIRASAQVPG
jgi:hypothetical protein